MQDRFLKEELIGAVGRDLREKSIRRAIKEIRRERDRVKTGKSRLDRVQATWLFENFYMIERVAAELGRYKKELYLPICSVADCYVEAVDFPDKENVSTLFEVISTVIHPDVKVLEGVKSALLTSCILLIAERLEEGREVGGKIELLRQIEIFDFVPFTIGFSEAERYLRSDPAGVWQRMRGESRGLYKRRINKMAKRDGVSFEKKCEELLTLASEKNCHIGEFIDFKNPSRFLYYPLLAIIFLLGFAFSSHLVLSVSSGFLPILILFTLAFPLFETSERLCAFIMSLFFKSDILPRVEIDGISRDIATLVVVPALIPDKESALKLFSHLEKLWLKSRSRRGEDTGLYFGILADFPESDTHTSSVDEEIIDISQKCLESLNEKHGDRFVLFTRDRVLDKTSGRYVAHERKRGALIELTRFILGRKSSIRSCGAKLVRIKYVLTLDSDTDVAMGDISKMVGTMEHPLNRPILEKKHGVTYVKKGYGILQPRIETSLESGFSSPFSLLISGIGGNDIYHGPAFDLFHVLHRRSMFCGKGIFDAECYLAVLENAFPDGIILSHDMLEGSRLRAGLIPDMAFSDSVPKNVISYYKRAHRWARGDVQALAFTTSRVPDKKFNTVKNPQSIADRFYFFSGIIKLLSPIFSVLAIFLCANSPMTLSVYVLVLSTSPLWLYSVIQTVSMLTRLSFARLFRRFFGEALTGLVRELVYFLASFSSLFFRAWKNFTAICTSLWRIKVSGKGLLEWSTAQDTERGASKEGLIRYFLFSLPSFVAGTLLLVLSTNGASRLVAIAFILFFVFGYVTAKNRRGRRLVSSKDAEKLKFYAEKAFGFFDTVSEEDNFLPCDNLSVYPNNVLAHRTSPTNIGLYMLSLLAACDLGFISPDTMLSRVDKTLSTVEKLPKYKGHLYNWYDTKTLEVCADRYISFVDSGNFTVCLLTLRMGLLEYADKLPSALQIARRLCRVERDADFRFLYNSSRKLFCIGYNADTEQCDNGCYDLYMSEARTTDYYAVARGIVDKEHWSHLSRALVSRHRRLGSASWSGTAFEYFMPAIFLPTYLNSFADEALSFAFCEQVEYSSPTSSGRIWGTSESGYFAFDRDMNYQYKAFGVPSLALSIESERDRVISPYSTFLMLSQNPSYCIKNLERLEKCGMWGEYGFYESLDLTPSRVGGGFAMVKSYMAHHVGMSILSVANVLLDGIFRKRFMRDSEMGSAVELLQEKIPVDASVVRRKSVMTRREKMTFNPPAEGRTVCKNHSRRAVSSLVGRDICTVLDESGIRELSSKGIGLIRPDTQLSFLPFIMSGDELFTSHYEGESQFACGGGFAEYSGAFGRITLNLSSEKPAVRVKLTPSRTDDAKLYRSGIYIEPSAVTREAYVSHPAYTELFFEAFYDEENQALFLEYKGREGLFACLLSDSEFEFEVFRERVFSRCDRNLASLSAFIKKSDFLSCETGTLLSPCILARASGEATFVIGYGKNSSEAYLSARAELEKSQHKSICDSDTREKRMLLSAGLTGIDASLSERLLYSFSSGDSFNLCKTLPKVYSKNALWSLGISGTLPISAVKGSLDRELLKKIMCLHRYHYISGISYDLVFLCLDKGYHTPERDEVTSLLDETRCRFMENQPGGIFVVGAEHEELIRCAATSFIEGDEDGEEKCDKVFEITPTSPVFPISDKPSGFSEDGYIIDKRRYDPEILWHHIIAGDSFGTLVSTRGLGHTWVYNAGLSRLDVWENDRVSAERGEKLYLKYKGKWQDVCLSAARVEFYPGVARYTTDLCEVSVSCHPNLLYKKVRVKLLVEGEVSLFYKISPVMGDGSVRAGGVFAENIGCGLKFCHPFSDIKQEGFGYLICPSEKKTEVSCFGVGCDKISFVGAETEFILGFAGSEKHFERVVSDSENTEEKSRAFAKKLLPDFEKTDFPENVEKMYNFHLPLQCAVSRVLARTGPYQSGGAWGGRDQSQDMLFLIDTSPERVLAHLFRVASHQFEEGDIMHWWHGFSGTRTLCSDDYLWFVLLLSVYFEKTGDERVFGKRVRYLKSPTLGANEREKYDRGEKGEVKENLVMHALRAIKLFFDRGFGAHGLPFMGSGDWNDGMDRIGEGGGESVWLGFFAITVIHKSFPMLEHFGIDTSKLRQKCLSLYERIEENAYFTDRYARAFLSSGSAVGTESFEGGCRIDSLSAAFASICYKVTGLGNPARISAALDTSWKYLYDEKNRIYTLFYPPFESRDSRIGYVTCYPKGVRENGGQYTHGAMFASLGYLWAPSEKKKNRERAEKILEAALTCERNPDVLKTEPYVLAADIYSNPDHVGRGGWSFYTGSAGWCRFVMSEILKAFKKSE